MEKIDNLDQLQALVRSHPRARTNFYLLPNQCQPLIDIGKLFYINTDDSLFIFEERDYYYKFYLRFSGSQGNFHHPGTKLVSYTTYRNEPDEIIAEKLNALGFRYKLTQIRLCASDLNIETNAVITPATEEEAIELFSEAFDPLYADLPCRGMFQNLAALRDSSGKPLGIVHYDDTKALLLIAVRPDAKKQGIATSLVAEFAKKCSSLPGDYHIWVVDNNEAALNLYRKLGFSPDRLKSDLYIF